MVIDSYEFGRMVVDGREYKKDLILFPDHVDPSWWRAEGHRLCMEDLATALSAKPDVLVIGTGCYGIMKVPGDVRAAVEQEGIQLLVAKTGEAVALFRSFSGGERVVAAFHLTC